MATVDTNDTVQLYLFNKLMEYAVKHFNADHGSVYYSDVIHDVASLSKLEVGDSRYWLIGDTCTVLALTREVAMDTFHARTEFNAVYTIERKVTSFGTKYYTIGLTD